MKYAFTLAALAATAFASPVDKRQVTAGLTDPDILNFALTLEHLEATFYAEAVKNYTEADFAAAGYDSTFYSNVKELAYDEATHVSFLTTALKAAGAPAVAACNYNFPATTVPQFVGLAAVLEGVGVSAYLGAANKIANPDYLTAAGSILTVEARHSATIRSGLKELPFAAPFDAPLSPAEVFTLAAGFIDPSCPSLAPLLAIGLKPYPALTATSAAPYKAGGVVTFSTAENFVAAAGAAPLNIAFITVTGLVIAETKRTGETTYSATIPKSALVNGQSYAILTPCTDNNPMAPVVAGPAILDITNGYAS